jgi:hypothetical protein
MGFQRALPGTVGRSARIRRLARDYERLPTTLAGLHFVVFAGLLFHQLIQFISSS